MKKYLRFLPVGRSLSVGLLLTVFCLTLNNSANAYTKNDLENLRLGSAVAEFIFSLPFLSDIRGSPDQLVLSISAAISEGLASISLESDTHLISEITMLFVLGKVHENLAKARLAETCLFRLSNYLIKNNYKERSNRRLIRSIVHSFIASFIISVIIMDGNPYRRYDVSPLGMFITFLAINGLGEFIGEKIIQGTEEESSSRHIY